MSESAERSATYKVMLERYRPGYRGAANLAQGARICQRWLTPACLIILLILGGLAIKDSGFGYGNDDYLNFTGVMVIPTVIIFIVGAVLSFVSSTMQSRLDGTVFATPGLSDEEKLALVTEVRAGLILAPSAATAHASPESPVEEVA